MVVRTATAFRQNRSTKAPTQVLSDPDHHYVREGYMSLMPISPATEGHLKGVLTDTLRHPGSLLRAQLAYSIMAEHGVDPSSARSVAIAIEYFHTASLIFDDMPGMDNALERRGEPCAHVVYGEASATLGALALINKGYALIWDVIGTLPEDRRQRASSLVSECLGADGILNGQAYDLQFANCEGTEDDILRVAYGKTVTLIRLTLALPAIVCGAADKTVASLHDLATAWGLSYQVIDDFKDCLMTGAETGKTTARDWRLDRPNLPIKLGLPKALQRLQRLLASARSIVSELSAHNRAWFQIVRLQEMLEAQGSGIQSRLSGSLTVAL